jgi:hypothetical protein
MVDHIIGRGPRFIGPRFGLSRGQVRYHPRVCFPSVKEEVLSDLKRMAEVEMVQGGGGLT